MATIDPHDETINGDEAKVIRWAENFAGNNIDLPDVHSFTVLHWACRKGKINLINTLLAKKANVNASNEVGDTPLHYAVSEGRMDIVQKLMEHNPNVNAVNKHGNTPLHYACFWRFNEIAMLLAQKGAIVAQANKYGETPLTRAGKTLGDALKSIAIMQGQDLETVAYKNVTVTVSTSKAVLSALGTKYEFDWRLLEGPTSIGLGWVGEVQKVKWNNKHSLAYKVFLDQNWTPTQLSKFTTDVQNLRSLNHDNILPLLGAVLIAPHIGFVSELLDPNKSLYNIAHKPEHSLDQRQAVQHLLGIASAMKYIHSQSPPALPYFEVNSYSFFVDGNGTVRLNVADTSLARMNEKRVQFFKPQWMAPEVLKGETVDKKKADIFSFAVIMYELLTRFPLYDGMNPMQIGMKVALEQLRPVLPDTLPRHFNQLISICWQEDANKRPAFEQITPILEKLL